MLNKNNNTECLSMCCLHIVSIPQKFLSISSNLFFCNIIIYYNILLKYYFVISDYHGTYRNQIPPVEKIWIYGAEIMGGLMWWWVLWHFWHDFGHIVVSIK